MPTRSEYKPPLHIVQGFVGDGIPYEADTFRLGFSGETIDAADWSAIAQLRSRAGSDTIAHTFAVTLQDNGDDPSIDIDELEVSLAPLTGAESAALAPGEYAGDIQITQTGSEPLTVIRLAYVLLQDVSR